MDLNRKNRAPSVGVLAQMLTDGTIRFEVVGSECGRDAVSIVMDIPGLPTNHLMLYVPKTAGEGIELILAEYLFRELVKETMKKIKKPYPQLLKRCGLYKALIKY